MGEHVGGSRGFAARHAARARALRFDELAWIALLPCAAVILATIVVLGPPIGHGLLAPGRGEAPWPQGIKYVFGQPEPVKRARFAIAMLGPPLFVAILLVGSGRRLALRGYVARTLVLLSQTLTLAALAAAVLGQYDILLPWEIHEAWVFGPRTFLASLLISGVLLAVLRHSRVADLVVRAARDTRLRRAACLVIAALLTAAWLSIAIDTEASVGRAQFPDLPPWAMGDTFAILDGRTPLVNFYPLYGQLWAYVAAGPMAAFGATITTFTIVMTTISGVALLALYGVFRRVVRSSIGALLLYLPVLGAGFLTMVALHLRLGNNAQIFSVWPMRYAGTYALAWLIARHIDGARPHRAWPLFMVAGLVVLNNLEFGIGALVGTIVALLCARQSWTRRAFVELLLTAAGGLAGALALLTVLTLVRSGRPPDLRYLLEYPRIFGVVGYASASMLTLGFHLVLYATFVAALAVAVGRLVGAAQDRLLTGMLAWSGTFGLFAGSYFAGRSDSLKLASLLSAWGFALALLLVCVLRRLSARGWTRPSLPELLVMVGFGLAVCTIVHLPTPWSQIARLRHTTTPPLYEEAAAKRLVADSTSPGEKVVILIPMGGRIAYDLGIVDVSPYAYIEAMVTRQQWRTMLVAMRREHARKLYVPSKLLSPQQIAVLRRAGFSRRSRRAGYAEWMAPAGVVAA